MRCPPTYWRKTGPIAARRPKSFCGGRHGWPFGAFYGDIGALGYVEAEYFIAGQALRFAPVAALGQDGRWSVEPTTPEDTPRRRHETSSQFAETRIGQKVYNQGKNERAVTS